VDLVNWDGILRLLGIALIDVALSGDNAIVIGMAAAALPHGKRRWAIAFGGACAIFLRIALTAVATELLVVPFLSAAGGVVLVWVVYRLLRVDLSAGDGYGKRAATMGQAIVLIAVADLSMSLDNVIAVAGSAHGSVTLLVLGLLLSMPLLLTTGGAISMLIDRFRWLIHLGAFAISFTAAQMVLEDQAVKSLLHVRPAAVLLCAAAAGVLIPAACWALSARRMAARSAGSSRR
jgi:YjbE family integral membrane protein